MALQQSKAVPVVSTSMEEFGYNWVIIIVYPVPILCWNIMVKSGRVEIAEFSISYCRMAFWWIDGDLMECGHFGLHGIHW